MADKNCFNCDFAQITGSPLIPQIECRRYPPGAHSFPAVAKKIWCGEHQPRTNPPRQAQADSNNA